MTCNGQDAEIIRLRQDGLSGVEVATELGIGEIDVSRCLSRHGLAGKYRVRRKGRGAFLTLRYALKLYGEVWFRITERGGYVVTLKRCYTGHECSTLVGAIRSAGMKAPANRG